MGNPWNGSILKLINRTNVKPGCFSFGARVPKAKQNIPEYSGLIGNVELYGNFDIHQSSSSYTVSVSSVVLIFFLIMYKHNTGSTTPHSTSQVYCYHRERSSSKSVIRQGCLLGPDSVLLQQHIY